MAKSDAGKVVETIHNAGVVQDQSGFKVFKKTATIANPFPENGIFARVMPKKFALENGTAGAIAHCSGLEVKEKPIQKK